MKKDRDAVLEVSEKNVGDFINILGLPQKGELNYDEQENPISRLKAIKSLKELELRGVIPFRGKREGINLHIHTNESFSVFRSPAEAAWAGYSSGLETLGINDHYTIEGHKEFGEACEILGLKAVFSVEAIAMSEKAKNLNERYNDPLNPGRTYLCGKGVVRNLREGSSSEKLFIRIRKSFQERCRQITRVLSQILSDIDPSLTLSFDEILKLTPHGNVTERHIAQGAAELVRRSFPRKDDQRSILSNLIGKFSEEDLTSEDRIQNLIRDRLLKAGGRAYVEEPQEAFPTIQDMVRLFRDYGSIPTYPILGNPVTEKEKDLDSLFKELAEYGIFAVEVIPKRNTRNRLQQILAIAQKHKFPVFNGTEHNTKSPEPLLDNFSSDPAFMPIFRRGANLILGHQFLSKYAGKGFISGKGRLTIPNREKGTSIFVFFGKFVWQKKTLKWLTSIGKKNTFKVVLALHSLLKHEDRHDFRVNSSFKCDIDLLNKINLKEFYVEFENGDVEKEFRNIIQKNISKTRYES